MCVVGCGRRGEGEGEGRGMAGLVPILSIIRRGFYSKSEIKDSHLAISPQIASDNLMCSLYIIVIRTHVVMVYTNLKKNFV